MPRQEGGAPAAGKKEKNKGEEGKGGKQTAPQGKQRGEGKKKKDEEEAEEAEDEADDEEEEEGSVHFNDLFTFTSDGPTPLFHLNRTKGRIVSAHKQSLTAAKKGGAKDSAKAAVADDTASAPSVFDFNPVVDAPLPVQSIAAVSPSPAVQPEDVPCPAPRRSASMCVKDGVVWLYGGVCENDRGREHTFSDLWTMELGGAEWREVNKDQEDAEWKGSDDEKEDDGGDQGEEGKDEEEEEEEGEEGEEQDEEGERKEAGGDG